MALESAPGQVVVELELAHHKPALQHALLGEQADTVQALLLQAQHLETLEIPVVARLGPVMPGIHDQANGFTPLLRNLAGADLRHVSVDVGHLHMAQLRKLVAAQRELGVTGLLDLARAYGVDPMWVLHGLPNAEPSPSPRSSVFKLKPRRAQVFAHGLEQVAREHDHNALRLPSCGCRSHCELSDNSARQIARASHSGHTGQVAGSRYESVMGRDLFADLG